MNTQIDIVKNGTTTLATAGKYCDRNIDINVNTPDRYEEGKKAEYDAFWDAYQNKGARTNYGTSFSGNGWTKETFRPKYDIVVSEGYMMFRYHNQDNEPYDLAEHLETLGVKLRLSYASQYMFSYANVSRIPPLDFTVGLKAMQQTFSGCKAVTIDKLKVNASTTYESPFSSMSKLQNLTIEGTIAKNGLNLQWSTKLSKASIESVINALSTTTSGLSITLSKTAVNNAFTTDEWTSLAGTKSNWTINLV